MILKFWEVVSGSRRRVILIILISESESVSELRM